MNLTWLDGSSWLIEMAGVRVLLDPWLVGDLVFGNAPWFFRGFRTQPIPIPENVSLILLSQGLPDHAHPETLKQFDRSIPVVGSPEAAKVARDLGFTTVTALAPSETLTWQNQIEFKAFPGSPLGPQVVGNAYVLKDLASQTTLYTEPHGYHSPKLKEVAPVDVVLTPLVGLKLPLVGAFIQAGDRALDLLQMLQPQVVLPTTTTPGGQTQFTGWLINLISAAGSVEEFCDRIRQTLPTTQVLTPISGRCIDVPLKERQRV
jgi:L-ascorbate metabolism protein UlaG (beta-lactamase superfamily)